MDLVETTDFIALDNPERASEFEDDLLAHARKIAHAPLGYVEQPDFKKGIQSCAHGACVSLFTVDEQGLRIERILHSACDLGPLPNQ